MFQLIYIYQMKKMFEHSENLQQSLIIGYSDSRFWELVIKLQRVCICFWVAIKVEGMHWI